MAAAAAAASATTAGPVQFNRDIRPILSDHCFSCHGPDVQKMKGGLRLDVREAALRPAKSGKKAILPRDAAGSELVHRLLTDDADELMPPPEAHKPLKPEQKALLQRWIAEGAEYQGHWAYQPIVRPSVPPGPEGEGGIDRWVRSHLDSAGQKPAPEADRRTLARRLSLDLTGLPATPEMVATFEADTAPGAYERMVDRLMSSPQYGERMAIGWLDVVRFADTIGYHSDTPRNIWPYRDYVIRSFNNNKPFDQFTREQLAGDLFPNPTLEERVASGFNRLLLTTEEGGAQEKDYESRYLTDRVRAVGTVWMGQTIGCAQCHDHKFDPITARDFYSMGAFFADVKETIIGRREDGMLVPTEPQARELARLTHEAERLKSQFEGPHPKLESAFGRWRQERLEALRSDSLWTATAPTSADSTGGATVTIRDDRSVLIGGKNPDTDSTVVRFASLPERVVGVRVEVLPDKSLPSQGPGRAGNGNFVLTEVVARVVRDGVPARDIAFESAWASHEQTVSADKNPYAKWSAASVIDHDARGTFAGWAILPEAGKPSQLRLRLKEPLTLASGERLEIELQQKHGHGHHTLGCFRLGVATDPAAVVPPTVPLPNADLADRLKVDPSARTPEQSAKLWAEFKAVAPELADLRAQRTAADKARADFEGTIPRTLVTERSEKPRTVRVLPRGNWLIETGEIMEPAIPAQFRPASRAVSDRRLNRLDLADWLVSPENPLTARVVVNRFWRQFFGTGLSKVLDDFGAQGEPPRHPELLDWLAAEFRDSGWDVKHLVRLMVTSRTYRQSSNASRELLARDPENRDLARQGRWRIEAEMVRDSALQVSGLLVPRIGGPSVRPYQPDGYWENLNFPQRGYDASSGGDQYRRGLYTWWQRSYVHPSMLAFDAATREECAAERNRSNIPQQALVLLNDPSYVEAARSFAARILREGSGDDTSRLTWAWRQALARAPLDSELSALRRLLETQRTAFAKDPEAASQFTQTGKAPTPAGLDPVQWAAWTDVARALLNLHETITRS
ncbi:MAG: hypothetical protein RIS24_3097 [Verrucomicrobiota bacterium]|jgi:hypothetical protein